MTQTSIKTSYPIVEDYIGENLDLEIISDSVIKEEKEDLEQYPTEEVGNNNGN